MTATPDTQTAKVLDWLQAGEPITALDALNHFGCFRLAARIKELRNDGHEIISTPTTTPAGARISSYRLKQPFQAELF